MEQHNLKARINSRTINFSLYTIDNSDGAFKVNDRPSDFICESLRMFGDAIRPGNSQHIWLGGKYLWFTENQELMSGVWVTDNGILMYQGGDDLFRIVFN